MCLRGVNKNLVFFWKCREDENLELIELVLMI